MKALFIKFGVAIIILASVLTLVPIRLADRHSFKTDASIYGMDAVSRSNIVDLKGLNALTGGKLILVLDDSNIPFPVPEGTDTASIPADSIFRKDHINLLRKTDSAILLYSADISEAAGAWMVLSQTGIRNIYILTNDPGNEILKYQHQVSDTGSVSSGVQTLNN